MRGALVGWWVPRPSLALALLLGLGASVLGRLSECRRRARSGVIPATFRRPCFCGKSKCVLLFASDVAGLALFGASVDPTATASGMRDAGQGRSQVNGLVFAEKSKCVLLFASDGAGLALLGASVDPTAIASGMRDARQGRSQVNGRACEW